MKVSVYGQSPFIPAAKILAHPVLGWPFSLVEHELVTDHEEADFILICFPIAYTSEANHHARAIMSQDIHKKYGHKFVWVTVCDFPDFCHKARGWKLVLSPPEDREKNIEHQVIPIPLHLCEADWRINQDRKWIEHCRNLPKKYDFCFVGNVTGVDERLHGGRKWIKTLKERGQMEPFFLRNRADSAWQQAWEGHHREWMERVAESRFGFAPADSSTSPRLFWTMQVGTVPIMTDYCHLPFDDEVDWQLLGMRVPPKSKLSYPYQRHLIPGNGYTETREQAIRFWDDYCPYEVTAQRVVAKMLTDARCGV